MQRYTQGVDLQPTFRSRRHHGHCSVDADALDCIGTCDAAAAWSRAAGGRPTWCIVHSEIAAAAATLGWWEQLPDPWKLQTIREEKARQQAKLDAYRRRGYR